MQIENIEILGVRQNNLKGINLQIPLEKMTVITGVSGSGKSSLAFETLYAEGSRRYIESLSTYARQFLEKMPRPLVEAVHNVPPAIALEQRNSIVSSRTNIAMMTEIYDYLRLLFAAIGKQNCQACGHPEVQINTAEKVFEKILQLPENTKLYILSPFPKHLFPKQKSFLGQELFKRGFQRLLIENSLVDLSSAEGQVFTPEDENVFIVIDRLVTSANLSTDRSRLIDSLEQAFLHGDGSLLLRTAEGEVILRASNAYSCLKCGTIHTAPTPPLFSFNSPLGACPQCSGFGEVLELDEELVVPDPRRTLRDGAVDPLAKPANREWQKEMLKAMETRGVSSGTRYSELTEENKKFLWDGEKNFPGIRGYFAQLARWKYKLHVRVFIRRYQCQKICLVCQGTRLTVTPLRFTIGEGKQAKNIAQVIALTIAETQQWFHDLKLNKTEKEKTREVCKQIADRIDFLNQVGISYLTLNRKGNSLSGGEYQRICLATQVGSKLSNTLYVLDEPTIGLHPEDTNRLITVMKQLRDHGNTLVIVEHDENIMKSADYLIEIGPKAGAEGGHLIAYGTKAEFLKNRNSLTSRYLSGELKLLVPKHRRPVQKEKILLSGCTENNLKNISLEIPLGLLVAVTGVSGSGKSTLIYDTLYKVLARFNNREPIPSHEIGKFKKITGHELLRNVSLLDQTPIGRSRRSNPATYLKIYDEIRRLMAAQPEAARKNYTPSVFSFNVDGGRCPVCLGEGMVEVDMHFMANVELICDACEGKRFKKHILEVKFKGKNINDILHTTVKEAIQLFADYPSIIERLNILESVGLSYLELGQPVSTLSGGECQRLKIALTLEEQRLQAAKGNNLYIFDEPTTGLHNHDIKRLSEVMHNLVNQSHSVIFIEHNMGLVAQADWVIDIGPYGGEKGGTVVATGTPEQVARAKNSLTAKHLAHTLGQ